MRNRHVHARALQVAELAQAGVAPRIIALQTGLARETVHNYLRLARRSGMDIPSGPVGRPPHEDPAVFAIAVGRDLHRRLCRIAVSRDTSVSLLCQSLLSAILDDDLIDAVLDDGEANHG